MEETPETIRQQMEETKLQLNEKLETLELQVAETVQSTGTAVNATVEAVQETVQSVSGAVQDAVHSVSDAFDIKLQIERHPFLVLGGAVVFGYLLSDFFTGNTKQAEPPIQTVPTPPFMTNNESWKSPEPIARPPQMVAAAEASGQETSSWNQLRNVAIGALIGVVQDVASRSVPRIVDYLTGESAVTAIHDPVNQDERTEVTNGTDSSDAGHHFRIASSGTARTGNSF